MCTGTSDYLVFAKSSEMLYTKLQESNIYCDLKVSVGGGHSYEKMHPSVEPSISPDEMQEAVVKFILKYI